MKKPTKSGGADHFLIPNFLHDFLIYLEEAKRELLLTQRGNLKLAEIKIFGDKFKKDIYHRDDDGSILFAIRSEEEVNYLLRIRQIAEVMHLIYKRKGKLLLSQNGKSFLLLQPEVQYERAIFSFCNDCSWPLWCYTSNDNFKPLLDIAQENQALIWDIYLKEKNWINFIDFYAKIQKALFSSYRKDGSFDHCKLEIKKMIEDFETLEILEVKRVKAKYYGEDIDQFKLSDTGRTAIKKIITNLQFDSAEEIKAKNQVLPQIKLKYYQLLDKDGKRPATPGTTCGICGQKDIVIGGGFDRHTKNPKVICEQCAIDRYMETNGFTNREVAISHRRRMFDVGYLLQEMITDLYMQQNNIKDVNDIDDETAQFILHIANNLWNESLTHEEKLRLEKVPNQAEIEKELKKLING